MNSPDNIFKGNSAEITKIDIDSPIATVPSPTCGDFLEPYGKVAKEAEEKGETARGQIFRFLQVNCGFMPSFDTPDEPFRPMWRMDGKRSLIPPDLSASDVEAVRLLAERTAIPALRARLLDVVWELTNDHVAGAEAAKCYLDGALALDAPSDWPNAVVSFRRCLYLGSKFGRKKPAFGEAVSKLEAAARFASTTPEPYHCSGLMEVMLQSDVGDPVEFGAIAASIAESANLSGDLRKAQAYRELEAEWQKRAKNTAGVAAARLAAGEAAVAAAEARTGGPDPSYLAAASMLAEAIEVLRNAGATKERISLLRRQLNEWQAKSVDEFQTFSTGMDISKIVIAAAESVRGVAFQKAVFRLAFGVELEDPKQIREWVIEAAKKAPLTYMIGGGMVDGKGRTTVRTEGLYHLEGEAFDKALEAESFSHAAQFAWPFRIQGYVEPVRQQILNDHKPSFQDLLFLVKNNPFVPPGHEGIFLRGLHAGFHGDFLVAAHLLTPQIENSMRYVLESQGIDVSNLMSDGTQPLKMTGAIFDTPETTKIFGERLCFELRGCLIEKTAYNFRHRIAHGFVGEADCYSSESVLVWWLVLRICLTPLFQVFMEQENVTPKEGIDKIVNPEESTSPGSQ